MDLANSNTTVGDVLVASTITTDNLASRTLSTTSFVTPSLTTDSLHIPGGELGNYLTCVSTLGAVEWLPPLQSKTLNVIRVTPPMSPCTLSSTDSGAFVYVPAASSDIILQLPLSPVEGTWYNIVMEANPDQKSVVLYGDPNRGVTHFDFIGLYSDTQLQQSLSSDTCYFSTFTDLKQTISIVYFSDAWHTLNVGVLYPNN